MQRVHVVAGLALAVLAGAGSLAADDFWLIPNAFVIEPGRELEVLGQTSSAFPTSGSAVAPDRIAAARLIGADAMTGIPDLSIRGKSLLLRHRQPAEGQYVVAVEIKPRSVRESPASFRRYLLLEGAPEALARYERERLLPTTDSVTRRYAKYAKTLIQVGGTRTRAFDRSAGHVLEFVPMSDPAMPQPGSAVTFQLLMHGRPLAGAHVHAGVAPFGAAALTDTAAARTGRLRDASFTTTAAGKFAVPIDRAGAWNLRTIQIVPAAAGSGADWDVHWATFVFGVGVPAGAPPFVPPAATTSDSAAAAGVVDAFHRALAAGDSVAALALLAPDVVILESGGAETRDQYRGHHLPGDIAFARAVPSRRETLAVTVQGDVAWVAGTSIVQGQFGERAINSAGAELVVLSRSPSGTWLIRAIHWSSRARRN